MIVLISFLNLFLNYLLLVDSWGFFPPCILSMYEHYYTYKSDFCNCLVGICEYLYCRQTP